MPIAEGKNRNSDALGHLSDTVDRTTPAELQALSPSVKVQELTPGVAFTW